MASETFITVIGKVHEVTDPKYMDDGSAVTKVVVVSNARKFNRQSNEWENKPGKFWDCRAWNQGKLLLADNVSNTLKKGDGVILYGELETREWEAEGGQKRRADQLRIETIGKDLRWHQAPANDVPAAADQGWGDPAATGQGGWGNGPGATY